jgi:hypothetical protein
MQHIGSTLSLMPNLVSREHVLATRCSAICQDYLHISLGMKNIQVNERVIKVIRISYAEKQKIQQEIPALLGYINNNAYNFRIQGIVV